MTKADKTSGRPVRKQPNIAVVPATAAQAMHLGLGAQGAAPAPEGAAKVAHQHTSGVADFIGDAAGAVMDAGAQAVSHLGGEAVGDALGACADAVGHAVSEGLGSL